MIYLRRALSGLRVFVGGNVGFQAMQKPRPKPTEKKAKVEPEQQKRESGHDAGIHAKVLEESAWSLFSHLEILAFRSCKRNGPLVLCPAGGKAWPS